jgi:hypothetical protein
MRVFFTPNVEAPKMFREVDGLRKRENSCPRALLAEALRRFDCELGIKNFFPLCVSCIIVLPLFYYK